MSHATDITLFIKLHASSPIEALACNISFQMVTGAVLGFIDVKRGKDVEATCRVTHAVIEPIKFNAM